ncbi:MAG: UDP-glucose 6-dehydrogenase [Rickettsiales bacterium]|nr:UDP-glucose 6-dehydrogenase [Rickettsiales bacterium]
MRITMIGTGYVGLVSGVCLAELGWDVTCVDKMADKIAALNTGEIPIYEPGLEALVDSNKKAGRLHFTTDLKQAVSEADIVFIAVGTPPDKGTGKANLNYVFGAAEEIANAISGYTIVVTKSTVPVGTNAKVREVIRNANPQAQFDVASNPEFLREGSAIEDFMKPDRIVIGVQTDAAGHKLSDLYQPLTNKGHLFLRTDIETAEMIKYASNSFLATKIAFINEMADICEQVGANVELVAKGMGMDSRVGDKFLKPGPGFGGSCFPKDAMALSQLADEHGLDSKIVNTVIRYNLDRRASMADKITRACNGKVKGKTIAILGLTFKANTDDMRESPSLDIIPALIKAGATVRAYDPEGMENAKSMLPESVYFAQSPLDACDGAEAAVIVTEWQAFRDMDLSQAHKLMKTPTLVDLRNLFTPADIKQAGFNYYSIGRKPALLEEESQKAGAA